MEKDRNPSSGDDQLLNYNLKSDAVEDLVASPETAPEYSQEELNQYRRTSRFHVPSLVWILLIKAWFSGAVCMFIYWGLAMYIPGLLEMMFVLCFAQGAVTDLLVNNTLRFLEKTPGENDRWMFVSRKGVAGFVLNLLYGAVIIFCVYNLYDTINRVIIAFTGNADKIYLGVEPILFGLFAMGFDMLFIGAKRLLRRIVQDAKNAAG